MRLQAPPNWALQHSTLQTNPEFFFGTWAYDLPKESVAKPENENGFPEPQINAQIAGQSFLPPLSLEIIILELFSVDLLP